MFNFIKTNKIAIISIGVLSIIIGLLILILCKKLVEINEQKLQISAITDTVHQYKTKDNKNGAYIKTILGSRNDLLSIAKQKDSTIYKLLKSNKNITDATSLTTKTNIDTTSKTDHSFVSIKEKVNDTNKITGIVTTKIEEKIIKPDSINIQKHIDNPWYTADIGIINDSTKLKLSVINKFSITHEYKSNGFLKPKSLIVNVVDDNPYTKTTGLSSYQLAAPKSKFVPGIITGAAIVIGTLLLIHK